MNNIALALGLSYRLLQKKFYARTYQPQYFPAFLDKDQVSQINAEIGKINLDEKELDRSLKETQVIRRSGSDDHGMIDIWGVDHTIKNIGELADIERIKSIIGLHDTYYLKRVNVYLNNGIQHTRGFHVDSIGHKQIKCFIYLTDVQDLKDGPYTYVPHSQNYFWRTLFNVWYSTLTFRKPTDMPLFTEKFHQFIGNRGDLIVTSQDGYHRGWPQKDDAKRRLLVFVFNKGT